MALSPGRPSPMESLEEPVGFQLKEPELLETILACIAILTRAFRETESAFKLFPFRSKKGGAG